MLILSYERKAIRKISSMYQREAVVDIQQESKRKTKQKIMEKLGAFTY
jgi:hypothetical protein